MKPELVGDLLDRRAVFSLRNFRLRMRVATNDHIALRHLWTMLGSRRYTPVELHGEQKGLYVRREPVLLKLLKDVRPHLIRRGELFDAVIGYLEAETPNDLLARALKFQSLQATMPPEKE